MLFLIQDNNYAISVPVEAQTAGGNISRLAGNFPDLFLTEFDGCSFVESYGRLKDAVAYLRAGNGPALAHGHVIRPYSHSLSDDERLYKTEKEREEEAKRDPLPKMRDFLLQEGLATEEELAALQSSVDREVIEAADQALQMPGPNKEDLHVHLYSPTVDPTSTDFDTQPAFADEAGKEGTMVDLLNSCLRDELERDPRMLVFGEDVADATREDALAQVKGKGGVFKVTLGLQRRFGSQPRLQHPPRRGKHRRHGHGNGDSRLEAGRRDSVLRLPLAGLHANPQRALHAPLGDRMARSPVPSSCASPPAAISPGAPSITVSPARYSSPTCRAYES